VPARVSVFIGWSGPRSRAVAQALAGWLPEVIQAADTWVSEDMDRGAQWFATIGAHLKGAAYGLLCVTPENATEPWVLFEAGALALRTGEGLACPYLLDMAPAALAGPLAQLQAATANKVGTLQVVETINRLLDEGVRLSAERLRRAVDTWWPGLEAKLADARQVAAAPPAVPARSTDAKLDEVLEIVRTMQRSQGRVINTSESPIYSAFGATPSGSSDVLRALLQAMGYSPSEALLRVGRPKGLLDVALPAQPEPAPAERPPPAQRDPAAPEPRPGPVRHKIGKPRSHR
jgi:hypothetical protein